MKMEFVQQNGVTITGGILTKKGVAAHFHVSIRTVENWMKLGLPFRNPTGRCVRFDLAEIEHWMAEKTKTLRHVRIRAKRMGKTSSLSTGDLPVWPRSRNGSPRRMSVFPNNDYIVEDRRLLKYVCGANWDTLAG